VSRSLRRTIRKSPWRISINGDFEQVVAACADRQEGSWMSPELIDAYLKLNQVKKAHSLEVWNEKELVGGIFGTTIGAAFFAESKFHKQTNASKFALYHLVKHLKAADFLLLEVQFLTDHLKSLGAVEISA